MRCLAGIVVCLLPLLSLGQSSSSAGAVPDTNSPLATVLIHATDKRGNPVALTQTSLTVYVDRQQAEIKELKPANSVPLRFVLLLDLSRSDRTNLDFEKKAAAQIFEALSKDGNEGYLGAFTDKTEISPRPVQLSEVNTVLNQAEAGGATAVRRHR